MKKILITGANSYIGISLEQWLIKWPENYYIEIVDMIGSGWKEKDFSTFDVVFHVAGIVHIKETKENRNLYNQVNRDLAYETAVKAKNEGVGQFIFLSTMSVYGIETGRISAGTMPNPLNSYGSSKLQAEVKISELANNNFRIAILRPPMVYGKGCKGNYPRLSSLAVKLPIFPDFKNERSMIYIDNFSEFVRCLIDSLSAGTFFPQNEEFVSTSEMVSLIAKSHDEKIIMTSLFNPIIKILNRGVISKVFGNLTYDKSMSATNFENERKYFIYNLQDSILLTEKE